MLPAASTVPYILHTVSVPLLLLLLLSNIYYFQVGWLLDWFDIIVCHLLFPYYHVVPSVVFVANRIVDDGVYYLLRPPLITTTTSSSIFFFFFLVSWWLLLLLPMLLIDYPSSSHDIVDCYCHH